MRSANLLEQLLCFVRELLIERDIRESAKAETSLSKKMPIRIEITTREFVGEKSPPLTIGEKSPPLTIGEKSPPLTIGEKSLSLAIGEKSLSLAIGCQVTFSEPMAGGQVTFSECRSYG
jgi:hypothetical protein